ncbi:hypothetical protein NDU88_003894 [Pleurodeles waltl]|uniref:Uncharacterized protein n=1 Tax=Pleurodeles waltl TaxID=8319 RepID=A0AAV7VI84_PLEWA|nr:hypothetical protein NDU88_003894 [Pleurodeles waltl]
MQFSSAAGMDQHNAHQQDLSFESRRLARLTEQEARKDEAHNDSKGDIQTDVDLKALLIQLKSSFKTVHVKLDILTSLLDQMKQHVDMHEDRLDHFENCVSNVDDAQADFKGYLLRMDNVLNIIKAKNEDLEERAGWNNLWIIEFPESTTINKMEAYVEALLCELFGDALSLVFIVEQAHHSLRLHPSTGALAPPIAVCLLNYTE